MSYIKSFLVLLFCFLFINNTFAEEFNASIIDLDSTNSNLIKIFLDKNINSNFLDITGDFKVFNDLKSNSIIKDLENNKIVTITLSGVLQKNTSYSLLSVYGSEGTIDFKIIDLINGLQILGDGTTGIDLIDIIDSKTLKVTFSKEIIGEDIDIKILKEYKVDGLKINSDNNKVIEGILSDKLDINSNYLIMLFLFNTKEGDSYIINNSIYSFKTSGELSEAEIIEEKIIKEENKTGNIALNSAKTPDTGAETWILLLATFLVSSFIYIRKKFSR